MSTDSLAFAGKGALRNSPEFAQGWNTIFGAIRGNLAVSLKLQELAIVTIGAMNKANYEWQAHAPIFLSAGGNQGQLDAIKKGVPDAIKNTKLFDGSERATLALTYEMTRNVTVKKATMAKIRSLLPTQVVELILIATGIDLRKQNNFVPGKIPDTYKAHIFVTLMDNLKE